MMLSAEEIARFCARMGLRYVEGRILGGESVLVFRDRGGQEVFYRPDDVRRTLERGAR